MGDCTYTIYKEFLLAIMYRRNQRDIQKKGMNDDELSLYIMEICE